MSLDADTHRRSPPDAAQTELLARCRPSAVAVRRLSDRSAMMSARATRFATGYIAASPSRADPQKLDRVEALESSANRTQGGGRSYRQPRRHTAGSEQLYQSLTRLRSRSRWSGGRRSRGLRRLYRRDGVPIISSRKVVAGRLDRGADQYPNVADLMKTLGVKIEEVKSSPSRRRRTASSRPAEGPGGTRGAGVNDSYDWFRGLVRDRRKITMRCSARVADGRVSRPPEPAAAADRRDRRREDRAGLSGARKRSTRRHRCATISWTRASASFRS